MSYQTFKNVEINESILSKVKKLLAKAEGTDNLNEAETFIQKATELLANYNLTMSDVENHTDEEKIEIFKFYDLFDKRQGFIEWTINLVTSIADYNFCKVFITRRKDGTEYCKIVGQKTNVEVVEYITEVVKQKARIFAKKAYLEYRSGYEKKYSVISSDMDSARRMFYALFGVLPKIDEMKELPEKR